MIVTSKYAAKQGVTSTSHPACSLRLVLLLSETMVGMTIGLQHEIRHLHQLGHAECQSIVLGGILAVSGVSHDCNDFRCQPDL